MTVDRDLVAKALPAYEIGGELGRGGWGVVLEGRHRELDREVAIKQLPQAFGADPAVRARFVAEARLLAGLDHPHIVPVYDFVQAEGLCLLVMEKLGGGTVWTRFAGEGLSMGAACAVALATCAAMDCAHARGVLHRDIKPENLLFSTGDVLKVADFGIAKVVSGARTLATRGGEVLGTPTYMAPEQARAKSLTPATDVYATGTMLYELLSGQLPFVDDGDPIAALYRHVYEQPTPLPDVAPNVPVLLADAVMRAIATDPTDRYPSAEAFGVALAEAATTAWGVGWLGQGDVRVMAAVSIVAATERASRPMPLSDGAPATGSAPPTRRAGAGPARVTEPSAVPTHPPAAPTDRVRPSVELRSPTRGLHDVTVADLVPVQDVLPSPADPKPLALVALGLLLAALATAWVGLGSPAVEPGRGGRLALNGTEVGAGPARLDLSDPVAVEGTVPPGAAAPARVALRLSAAGAPLGSASAVVSPGPTDGSYSATVDVSGSVYLVPGRATAEVELQDGDGQVVDRRTFPVTSAQSAFLTAPAIAAVILAVFVACYVESLVRRRRRGRKVATATVGLVVLGALGGVAAAVLGSVAGGHELTGPTVLLCVALAAAAGLATVTAAARSARRRRPRPKKADAAV